MLNSSNQEHILRAWALLSAPYASEIWPLCLQLTITITLPGQLINLGLLLGGHKPMISITCVMVGAKVHCAAFFFFLVSHRPTELVK